MKKIVFNTYKNKNLTPKNNFLFFYIFRKQVFVRNKINLAYLTNQDIFILKKKNFKKCTLFKNTILKLNSFFNKNGNFLKQLTTLLSIYSLIYSIFLNFNIKVIFKNEQYLYVKEFLYNLNYNTWLRNANNLLTWFLAWNTPLFYVNVQKVPKKFKKKLKKKYLYKVMYVKKKDQKKKALNWVYLNNYNYENIRKFKKQLFFNKLDLILNYKKSILYKQKTIIYKKMFKK